MEWIITCTIFFVGSVLHALTGFGFVVFALPILIMFKEPHQVVILCTFLGFLSCAFLMIRSYHDVHFSSIKRILAFSVLGLPFGALIFKSFDITALRFLISTMICLFAFTLLFRNLKIGNRGIYEPITGFFTGVFQTSIGMPGIPPAVYFTLKGYNQYKFRGSINAVNLCLTAIALIIFWCIKKTELAFYTNAFSFFPMIVIGQYVGWKVHEKLSREVFRKIVIITIIISSMYNLIRIVIKLG